MGAAPARLRAGNGLAILEHRLRAGRRRRGEGFGRHSIRLYPPARVRAAAHGPGDRVFAVADEQSASGDGWGDGDAAAYTRRGLGPVVAAPKEGAGWLFGAAGLAMQPSDLALWDASLDRPLAARGRFVPAGIRAHRLEERPDARVCAGARRANRGRPAEHRSWRRRFRLSRRQPSVAQRQDRHRGLDQQRLGGSGRIVEPHRIPGAAADTAKKRGCAKFFKLCSAAPSIGLGSPPSEIST